MVIYFNDAKLRDGGNIEIRNYITRDVTDSFSLAVATLNGLHDRTVSVSSDRAYFIIDGNAVVTVGSESKEVSSGDAVFIPQRTPHSIEGRVNSSLV